MTRYRRPARTYVRPMAGWWRKNPDYVRYMVREGSAVFLSVYALVLLAGRYCLARGETAYAAWRAALASPVSISFHIVALVLVAYHSDTWFRVMPKTAPQLPFAPRLLTLGGWAATAVLSVVVVALIAWAVR
jgi:fumarate reductase subunit C